MTNEAANLSSDATSETPRLNWADGLWLLATVAVTGLNLWTLTREIAMGRTHFYAHPQYLVNSLAFLVLPFAAVLLLQARRASNWYRIVALWAASVLAALIAYATAFVVLSFVWPPLLARTAWFALGALLVVVFVPVILLPVSLYVLRASRPRVLPVIGMTSVLMLYGQPVVSIVVLLIALGVGVVRRKRRPALGAAGS